MKRILFVELLGGLGDLIIALPAIHALAVSHPGAELTVLTFAPSGELLQDDPLVARVVTAERGDTAHPERPRQALEALLAGERFDLVVSDTTYDGMDRLVDACGARAVSNLWRQPPADQLIQERFLQILGQEGLLEPWAQAMAPRLSLGTDERLWAAGLFAQPGRRALLHPHAGMPIKAWPPWRFVELGRSLHAAYGLEILIPSGSEEEGEVALEVATGIGPAAFLLPPISLRQLAAAASCVDLAVGADTGPMRIAAAAGAPTITLFGPSWHGRYGQRPPHANLQGFPECPERQPADFTRQRCWYAGVCPLGRWRTCLEDISLGDVLEAAQGLLSMAVWWGKRLPEQAQGLRPGR